MAYKFQVGPATLSGSTTFKEALEVKSTFAASSVSASAAVSGGSLDIGGDADIDGNLDVGGLFKMADNASGKLLIGDGSSYEEVAMSGDIAIDGAGVTTIQAGAVEHGMLAEDIISGQSALTSVAQADLFMVDDGPGEVKKVTFSDLEDAIFGNVSGDATVAAGGALTIADNAVGLSKMAGITRGSLIVGDSSGDPSYLAKGTSAQFLQSDGSDPVYVSISGDATIASGGALTIGAGKVTNSMLSGGIANAKLVNDAVTLTAGAGMGTLGAVALGNSITVAVDGVLEDLDDLGVPSADGQFIVATGAGTFAYETGSAVRTSLGLGTGDKPNFAEVSASAGFATPGVVQATTVQASTYNGDSVAVTGITGSLNNKLSHGAGIAPFSFNNGASVQVALSSSVAGAGLAHSAGVLSLDIDELSALGGTGVDQADHFVFSDGGTEKKITFSNLEDAIFGNVSGDVLVAAGGAATIQADAVESGMLNDNVISGQTELAAADIADADEMLISDGGTLKKVGVDSLATFIRGMAVNDIGDASGNLAEGLNFSSAAITANRDWVLPTSPALGDQVIAKASVINTGVSITVKVDVASSQLIDGVLSSVSLEEDGAAVTLVYGDTNRWFLV